MVWGMGRVPGVGKVPGRQKCWKKHKVWVEFLGEYWREKGCDLHPLLALPRIMCVVGVAV